MTALYSTLRWRVARRRALERDGNRCTIGRLTGEPCSGASLHVHHIVPVGDGGALFDLDNLGTTCASHHPRWEAIRRTLLGLESPRPVRCPHKHRTAEGRRICEARLARARDAAAA